MNRLVLVGNGFDLAHGMPTRYNDFLLGYLKRAFNSSGQGSLYQDRLMMVTSHDFQSQVSGLFDGLNTTDDLIEHCYKNGFLNALMNNKGIQIGSITIKPLIQVYIRSDFFRILLSKCNVNNWVEIENEYYLQLKKILKLGNKGNVPKELEELNTSMHGIIEALKVYLSELDCVGKNMDFTKIFEGDIVLDEMPLLKQEFSILPKETLILNFNYTSTVERYISDLKNVELVKVKINNIHGTLNDIGNPMIFGFGDEIDEDYQLLEKAKTKGFFKFIKSFWYFRTENYHNLIRFIESEEFQVVVLGHSCGLSDRTMLNLIFEHKNCKGIKIYYYANEQGDNFNELTEEISRHFSNKAALRAKVLPKPLCVPMPQINVKQLEGANIELEAADEIEPS